MCFMFDAEVRKIVEEAQILHEVRPTYKRKPGSSKPSLCPIEGSVR